MAHDGARLLPAARALGPSPRRPGVIIAGALAVLALVGCSGSGSLPSATTAGSVAGTASTAAPSSAASNAVAVGQSVSGAALAAQLKAAMDAQQTATATELAEGRSVEVARVANATWARMDYSGREVVIAGDTVYAAKKEGGYSSMSRSSTNPALATMLGVVNQLMSIVDPWAHVAALTDAQVTVTSMEGNTSVYAVTTAGAVKTYTVTDGLLVRVDQTDAGAARSVTFTQWGSGPQIVEPAAGQVTPVG